MGSNILVTGGTGNLGRHVVRHLHDRGQGVRVISRREHSAAEGIEYVIGDLATGDGLDRALRGVGTVVHCASDKKGDAAVTRRVVAACEQDRTEHLVYVSIVGVDRLNFGYFRSKLESEQAIIAGAVPWTILRATQFYDMILRGAVPLGRLPLVPTPSHFEVQPIDPIEVAGRLSQLALDAPAGRVRDLAGPQRRSFSDLIRAYLTAIGKRRPVFSLALPGLGAIRNGALLPADPDATDFAAHTWEDFLADRLPTNSSPTPPPGLQAK